MIRLQRLMPLVGGLLLSKGARRLAGRHAGKLALATLAYEVWRNHRNGARPQAAAASATSSGAGAAPRQSAPNTRRRWSGRRPR